MVKLLPASHIRHFFILKVCLETEPLIFNLDSGQLLKWFSFTECIAISGNLYSRPIKVSGLSSGAVLE
jgi:hypothetical protein